MWIVLFFTNNVFGKIITIKQKGNGKVLSRVEGKYLDQVVYSNPEGKIEVPDDTTSMTLHKAGYDDMTIDAKSAVTFYMYPSISDSNEIIVTGVKRPEISRKAVSIDEARRISSGGDPVKIVRVLPGVQTKTLDPRIVVRGAAPEDSSYFIDQIEVPNIFHSIGGFSILPYNFISDIQFSAGGFGAQYGDITGGIVEVQTKNQLLEGNSTELTLNLPLFLGAYHRHQLTENQSLTVGGRKSFLEYIIPSVTESSDLTVIPSFSDAAVFWFQKNKNGFNKVSFLYYQDGLALSTPGFGAQNESGTGNFDLNTEFYLLSWQRQTRLSKSLKYETSPHFLWRSTKTDIGSNFFNIDVLRARIPLEFQLRLKGRDKLFFGILPEFNWVYLNLRLPDVDRGDPFADFESAPLVDVDRFVRTSQYASWLSYAGRFSDFDVNLGLRYNYDAQIRRSSYDPRFQVKYAFNKSQSLEASVGQYSQSPSPQESATETGNPDLRYIRSNQFVLALKSKWNDRWASEVQVYYNDTFHRPVRAAFENFLSTGQRKSYGVEVFLRRLATSRWFGWLSYTFSVTQERDNQQEDFHAGEFDQTHVINLTGSYRITSTWDLGMRLGYHTGDTTTPIDSSVYNVDVDKYIARQGTTELFSDRLPDFHQLDIYTSKSFLFDTWKLKLKGGVEYLSVEPQAQAVQYNYDFSKREFFRGLPPIPYIELSGEF